VAAARHYRAAGFEQLPRVLSVDVARFGDDQTAIGWRQGRKAIICGKYRGKDGVWVAEQVIRFIQSERPQAVVVDGDGLGAGVVDHLRYRGHEVFEFHGGATPNDESMYFNKRAEVWGMMRDWLISGAEIPDDPELEMDLTGLEYGFASGRRNSGTIKLEDKDDMKARGLSSPDLGDMLAMTFGVTLAPPQHRQAPRKPASAWS